MAFKHYWDRWTSPKYLKRLVCVAVCATLAKQQWDNSCLREDNEYLSWRKVQMLRSFEEYLTLSVKEKRVLNASLDAHKQVLDWKSKNLFDEKERTAILQEELLKHSQSLRGHADLIKRLMFKGILDEALIRGYQKRLERYECPGDGYAGEKSRGSKI